jgi:tetratricopeptide (TPR) repeat protein
MDNFLIIYADVEFIAGIISNSKGLHVPCKNKNGDEFLWLYFFNDPGLNKVTFGRGNKNHFYNQEFNYYGDFFDQITEVNSTFLIRGTKRPLIELLEHSGLIKLLQEAYYKQNISGNQSTINTLITFSSAISDSARQIFADYLMSAGFDVKSQTIHIAELITLYFWKQNRFESDNNKVVLLFKATNSTFEMIKLNFIDGYFFNDEASAEQHKGKGTDPRKKAITRYIVEYLNSFSRALNSHEEKEKESERFEDKADEWLRLLDLKGKEPLRIGSQFISRNPNNRYEVLVRKENIDSDTKHYTDELIKLSKKFVTKNLQEKSEIASIILFGDNLNNSQIKEEFEKLSGKDKLIVLPANFLYEALNIYPLIDLQTYGNASERTKLIQNARLHNQSREKNNAWENAKKQADSFFEKSDWDNSEIYYRKALLIKPGDLFCESQLSKINEARIKYRNNKEYQNVIKLADGFFDQEDWDNAESYYKKALKLKPDDQFCASRMATIIEARGQFRKIKEYQNAIKLADSFFDHQDWDNAVAYYEKALKIKPDDQFCQSQMAIIIEVRGRFKKNKEFQHAKKQADGFFDRYDFAKAEEYYKKALETKPGDQHCESQLEKIAEVRETSRTNKEYQDSIQQASGHFAKGEFAKAEEYYKKALEIKPGDQHCESQLEQIAEVRETSRTNKEYQDSIQQASGHFAKGEFAKAEEYYKKALEIKPGDQHCESQLEQIAELRETSRTNKEYQDSIQQASGHFAKGEFAKAEEYYKKALEIKPGDQHCESQLEQIAELRETSRTNKEYQDSIQQASGHFAKGEFAKAEEYYKKALEIKPGDQHCESQLEQIAEIRESGRKNKEYQDFIELGSGYFAKGEFAKAEEYYKKALEIKPGDQHCESQLEKIAEIRESGRKNKEYQDFIELASGYFAKGEFAKAEEYYKKALEIKPGDQHCESQLEKIAEIRESGRKNKEYQDFIELASGYFAKGEFAKAEEYYKKALEIKPGDQHCESQLEKIAEIRESGRKNKEYQDFIELASGYFAKGEFAKAEEYYKKALEIKPGDQHCESQLEKIAEIRESGRKNKEYQDFIELASGYFAKGEFAKAEEYYKKALEIKPGDQHCESQLEKIAECGKQVERIRNIRIL